MSAGYRINLNAKPGTYWIRYYWKPWFYTLWISYTVVGHEKTWYIGRKTTTI